VSHTGSRHAFTEPTESNYESLHSRHYTRYVGLNKFSELKSSDTSLMENYRKIQEVAGHQGSGVERRPRSVGGNRARFR
jgi:hypothetical protein